MKKQTFGESPRGLLVRMGFVSALWLFGSRMFYQNWGLLGVQEWIQHRIFGRQALRRTTCPGCAGSGICAQCDGKGCAQCHGDGHCVQCHGEGNLIIGNGNIKVNG